RARGRLARLITVAALVTALWQPAVYIVAARVAAARRLIPRAVGNKPYRDGYRAFLIPWGVGEHYPTALNEKLASVSGVNGLILIEDSMIAFGVRYAQHAGRIDAAVEIIFAQDRETNRLLIEADPSRPVILVPRDRDAPQVAQDLRWRRDGD